MYAGCSKGTVGLNCVRFFLNCQKVNHLLMPGTENLASTKIWDTEECRLERIRLHKTHFFPKRYLCLIFNKTLWRPFIEHFIVVGKGRADTLTLEMEPYCPMTIPFGGIPLIETWYWTKHFGQQVWSGPVGINLRTLVSIMNVAPLTGCSKIDVTNFRSV